METYEYTDKKTILSTNVYKNATFNKNIIDLMHTGYVFKDELDGTSYKIIGFRPPDTSAGESFLSINGAASCYTAQDMSNSPRFILQQIKPEKYIFTEDKNGGWRKCGFSMLWDVSKEYSGKRFRMETV